MKQLLAVLALVLGFASAEVKAELNAAEKSQVLSQINALHDGPHGLNYLMRYLTPHPEAIGQVRQVTEMVLDAHERHMAGVIYLLDGDGDNNHAILGMSRAQSRQAGIDYITGNGASYAGAVAILDAMVASCSVSCTNLQTARGVIAGAETKRKALNTSLAYEEPRLAENLAFFPEASRLKSTNFGPHGDYRRFLQATRLRVRDAKAKWVRDVNAAAGHAPYIATFVTHAGPLSRTARFNAISLGLIVGVEHSEVADDISAMFNGATTSRSRHFFRGLLIEEMFIGLDHLNEPPHDYSRDVFNRPVLRGNTYGLQAQCRSQAEFLASDPALPQWAKDVVQSMRWTCEEWAHGDNQSWNTLVMRFTTNTAPPGQVVGRCDPATTTLQPGPPPTCVGTGGGVGLSCGPGTHQEGQVCVPDPVVCPTYTPSLVGVTEPDRIEYRAVCVATK